jgi:hypothetical protein
VDEFESPSASSQSQLSQLTPEERVLELEMKLAKALADNEALRIAVNVHEERLAAKNKTSNKVNVSQGLWRLNKSATGEDATRLRMELAEKKRELEEKRKLEAELKSKREAEERAEGENINNKLTSKEFKISQLTIKQIKFLLKYLKISIPSTTSKDKKSLKDLLKHERPELFTENEELANDGSSNQVVEDGDVETDEEFHDILATEEPEDENTNQAYSLLAC